MVNGGVNYWMERMRWKFSRNGDSFDNLFQFQSFFKMFKFEFQFCCFFISFDYKNGLQLVFCCLVAFAIVFDFS